MKSSRLALRPLLTLPLYNPKYSLADRLLQRLRSSGVLSNFTANGIGAGLDVCANLRAELSGGPIAGAADRGGDEHRNGGIPRPRDDHTHDIVLRVLCEL